MTPDLATLVRQHAMTSRLLGVDFVPCFRVPPGAGDAADASIPALNPVRPADAGRSPGPAVVAPADPADAAERLAALCARYIADAPHEKFVTDQTSIVFGEGDPCARLMFVGEAPGADEDRTGRPFVGRAGQLLDKMIVAMGLTRESVYIANVLKTRPPNNQTPTIDEARLCAPYLYEQIRIVSPEVIVTLGRSASQLLLSTTESMTNLRGRWAVFPPADPLCEAADIPPIPVMPTYHPAFVLRQYTADTRGKVWSDLRQVMTRLGLPSPTD